MGSSCKQTQVTFSLSVSHQKKKHCAYLRGQTNVFHVFSSICGIFYSHVYSLAFLIFTAILCALLHIFNRHHRMLINKRNMYISSSPVCVSHIICVYTCSKVQQRPIHNNIALQRNKCSKAFAFAIIQTLSCLFFCLLILCP